MFLASAPSPFDVGGYSTTGDSREARSLSEAGISLYRVPRHKVLRGAVAARTIKTLKRRCSYGGERGG